MASFVGSITRFFAANWKDIDKKIANSLAKGLAIDFLSRPVQKLIPSEIGMSKDMKDIYDRKVADLLSKGAVCEVNHNPQVF